MEDSYEVGRLKIHVSELEQRILKLEKVSHSPVDLMPHIKNEVYRQLNKIEYKGENT